MDDNGFLDVIVLAERLHRQYLGIIQLELDLRNIRDINNVRALMLLNIGDAEMTASELLWRGCYLGSNVSYNLKKLTEAGYVIQQRSTHDKRVIMVRNSEKGAELCALLQDMNARHVQALSKGNFKTEDLTTCRQMLRTLQRFWSRAAELDSAGGAPIMANGYADGAGVEGLAAPFRPTEAAYGGVRPRAAV